MHGKIITILNLKGLGLGLLGFNLSLIISGHIASNGGNGDGGSGRAATATADTSMTPLMVME